MICNIVRQRLRLLSTFGLPRHQPPHNVRLLAGAAGLEHRTLRFSGRRVERKPYVQRLKCNQTEDDGLRDGIETSNDVSSENVPTSRRRKWQDSVTDQDHRHAKREIKWLRHDEVVLTNRVMELCADGRPSLAYSITQKASKEPNYAVGAYNILIGYFMNRKLPSPRRALEMYNDMRKRAQTPDAYTFGTLLSGFNAQPDHKAIVDKAYDIYKSTQRDKFDKVHCIKHTNMMLGIAAKARRMDILWAVIESLPDTGPTAPNDETYAHILHGLASQGNGSVDRNQIRASRQAFDEMRDISHQIWASAIDQWKAGELNMTTHLVGAMARVLLSSNASHDWDSVFCLIEQTTGIKRHGEIMLKHLVRLEKVQDSTLAARQKALTKQEETFVSAGAGVKMVEPNIHILMVLLDACQLLRTRHAVEYYWGIITGEQGFGLRPDTKAVKTLLGVYRQARSSAKTVEVLAKYQDIVGQDWGAYRIAMAACARNNLRMGTLESATELYELRKKVIAEADMKVIENFSVAISGSRKPEAQIAALEVLGSDLLDCVTSTKNSWKLGGDMESDEVQEEWTERNIAIAESIIGCYDRLEKRGAVKREQFLAQKQGLSEYVRAKVAERTEKNGGFKNGGALTWNAHAGLPGWSCDGAPVEKRARRT